MKYQIIGNDFRNVDEDKKDLFYENQMLDFEKLFPACTMVAYHFFSSDFRNEEFTIDSTAFINDYIENLAIKDGVNLVKFENGNIGFMASYSGRLNGFEIIPLTDVQKKAYQTAQYDIAFEVDYTASEVIRQLLNATEKELIDYIGE